MKLTSYVYKPNLEMSTIHSHSCILMRRILRLRDIVVCRHIFKSQVEMSAEVMTISWLFDPSNIPIEGDTVSHINLALQCALSGRENIIINF